MGFEGLLKLIAEEFAKANIRYALIGGIALHAAGYSRATGDIDALIHTEDSGRAREILLSHGFTVEHETEDVLNLTGPWVSIGGVDFIKAHRRYALAMLERAGDYKISDSVSMPVAAVEDLIGLKVQAMANDPSRAGQDLVDIEWLLRHHGSTIDIGLVREYFSLFTMSADLDKIMKKVGHA